MTKNTTIRQYSLAFLYVKVYTVLKFSNKEELDVNMFAFYKCSIIMKTFFLVIAVTVIIPHAFSFAAIEFPDGQYIGFLNENNIEINVITPELLGSEIQLAVTAETDCIAVLAVYIEGILIDISVSECKKYPILTYTIPMKAKKLSIRGFAVRNTDSLEPICPDISMGYKNYIPKPDKLEIVCPDNLYIDGDLCEIYYNIRPNVKVLDQYNYYYSNVNTQDITWHIIDQPAGVEMETEGLLIIKPNEFEINSIIVAAQYIDEQKMTYIKRKTIQVYKL